MAFLTLVRHGQASFASDDYDQLSKHGQWQSRTLGEHWTRCGEGFDRVHCGALKRQRQTAHTVLSTMDVDTAQLNVDAGFDEYATHPVFARYMPALLDADAELRTIFSADRLASVSNRAISRRVFFPVLTRWVGDAGRDDLGFECYARFKTRVKDALLRTAAAIEPGQHEVVFTSSGVIAVATVLALNLPDNAFVDIGWHIHNASVTRLAIDNDQLGLVQFNATMHLEATGEANALTWL